MTLTQLHGLAGTDVRGLRADIRTRNADGTLRYREQQPKAIIVTMKTVAIEQRGPCCGSPPRKEKGETLGPWLYWRWDGYSCGYAGAKDEGDHATSIYLLIETNVTEQKST